MGQLDIVHDRYRAAARVVLAPIAVAVIEEFGHVHELPSGAYVTAVIWIPKDAIQTEATR